MRLSAREEQMSQREAKIGPLPARALALSLSLYTALLFTRVFVYVDGLYVCRAARWSVYVLLYDVAARRQRWQLAGPCLCVCVCVCVYNDGMWIPSVRHKDVEYMCTCVLSIQEGVYVYTS